MLLFPAGDEGGEMQWVWPDESVVTYLPLPPPPAPTEVRYSNKLAIHLKKTRRKNRSDTERSSIWSDAPNNMNTPHNVSKKKVNGYTNNSESKEKVDYYHGKEERFGTNDIRTTRITAAADNNKATFTTPFTDLHNHDNNNNKDNISVAASSDSLLEEVNKRLAEALLRTTTTVTLPCAKLLRQGGRYCRRISDGDK